MRLQLSIHRNALPPVQFIFTTGTGPASHTKSLSDATIADLLTDVNELVPLESSDGEWGFEDYVVELAATADQDSVYECLHFQTLDTVLRDDDEVVIRALGGNELRNRRVGGRKQMTSDGRHLYDGLAWGSKWNRQIQRPGVVIPPRKKRRILATENDDEALSVFEWGTRTGYAAVTEASEEDEDGDDHDGDYEDKENIDYDKAVAVREDFDDADEESEDGSEDVEEDEIQLLLKDAEELDDVELDEEEEVLERQLKARTRLGKRKRHDLDEDAAESTFEGFSTPVKAVKFADVESDEDGSASESSSDDESESDAENEVRQIEANILGVDNDDTSGSSSDSASDASAEEQDSAEESSASEEDETSHNIKSKGAPQARQHQKGQSPAQKSPKKSHVNNHPSNTDGLESEPEDSESDESVPSTSSSLTEGDFTSSSGSDATSDVESSSSSESESDDEESSRPKKTSHVAAADFASKLLSLQSSSSRLPATIAQTPQKSKDSPQGTPASGSGSLRTQKNNERIKMRKRLNMLKEAGELPSHADFSDLKDYENKLAAQVSVDVLSEELEAARARLLKGTEELKNEMAIENTTAEALKPEDQLNEDESMQDAGEEPMVTVETVAVIPDAVIGSTANKRSSPIADAGLNLGSPSKRAKLDVAASRRLLFGSLGLRTPKTPAEEQALREKLAKQVRPEHSSAAKENIDPAPMATGVKTEQRKPWQEKLVVSAVECVREGTTLPPPPFPFVQNWHKKGKSPTSPVPNVLHYDGPVSPPAQLAEQASTAGFAPEMSTLGIRTLEDNLSNPESRTLSFDKEADGVPIPTDFNALAPLDRSHLIKGAIVAYKEIYVGAETNFQPEVSSFRVAAIDSVDDDGLITVTLSKRDRTKKVPYDSETGEAVTNNFEIAGSQDEDDGFRELDFAFMLEPKLVEAAKVQVPESTAFSSFGRGEGETMSQPGGDAFVPESLEAHPDLPGPALNSLGVEQVDIDTPRRNEITTMIKEAGFESAMDVQLLEPLPGDPDQLQQSSQPVEEVEQESVNSSGPTGMNDQPPSQVQDSYIETSKVVLEKSRVEDWSSSAVFPAANEGSGMDFEEDAASPEPANISSSPPVSLQLTVEYPHISQIEIRSSAAPLDDSTRLSSHQDAQRVAAVPAGSLGLDGSNHEADIEPASEGVIYHDDDDLASLHSDISQKQSADQQNDEEEEGDGEAASHSFLGKRGYDGVNSSYHESDDDPAGFDSDDSSLPSLRELTSSQKWKIKATTGSKKATSNKKRVSPPPVKRKEMQTSSKRESSIPIVDGGGDTSDEEDEIQFPAPSQRIIKVSASQAQAEKPRSASQIPAGTQVVDLTLSSDPVSPDHSDGEYGVMRPTRTRRSGSGAVNGGGSKRTTRAATLGASVSDVGPGLGLGKKRFFAEKKTRSQGQSLGGGSDYY